MPHVMTGHSAPERAGLAENDEMGKDDSPLVFWFFVPDYHYKFTYIYFKRAFFFPLVLLPLLSLIHSTNMY